MLNYKFIRLFLHFSFQLYSKTYHFYQCKQLYVPRSFLLLFICKTEIATVAITFELMYNHAFIKFRYLVHICIIFFSKWIYFLFMYETLKVIKHFSGPISLSLFKPLRWGSIVYLLIQRIPIYIQQDLNVIYIFFRKFDEQIKCVQLQSGMIR